MYHEYVFIINKYILASGIGLGCSMAHMGNYHVAISDAKIVRNLIVI